DILKDRLYASAAGSGERRAAQTVLFEMLQVYTGMLAPVLAFTCEEAWSYLPEAVRKTRSVHLSEWPVLNEDYLDAELAGRWDKILKIRGEASKALEEARNAKLIGNSLEARVELYVDGATKELLERYESQLAQMFIVASIDVHSLEAAPADAFKSDVIEALAIKVLPARGSKCERCWRYEDTVGDSSQHKGLCARCAGVLTGA
ncbi:MAG TPA: isoleucine--tRNA ligase, partial [Actinobacteria bacterium]|nr:isoleucine--tRNA ligase [Actinomycetota bacterium]